MTEMQLQYIQEQYNACENSYARLKFTLYKKLKLLCVYIL